MTTVTLRPHQGAAADAVEAAFRRGVLRPLVNMCVGAGKSLVYAELARREINRGGRSIIGAHTRELVEQNAKACRMLGLSVGINAAALDERAWRGDVISASIQSVFRYGQNFGPVSLLMPDESHLLPHSEAGMYHQLRRGLGNPRMAGGSGTTFRMQGGSLVEGEGAPFDEVVYTYTILDGIRDGYLCPAWTPDGVGDKMDATKLATRQGEYTGASQAAQMIDLMDRHIAQMVHYGRERRSWLVFEANQKAAQLMCDRMNAWNIPTGIVIDKTPALERRSIIEAFRAGRLRAIINVAALTTGFDVQEVDLLVFRRRTKSKGLYIQIAGRGLRTIGGNIAASVAAGKSDCAVLDFAGLIDEHGPLDFIKTKETKAKLVSCDACGARNGAAAARCWSCDVTMTKLCPACLENIEKYHLDCPRCGYDMRQGPRSENVGGGLLAAPSGAELIRGYRINGPAERQGGWLAIEKVWREPDTGKTVAVAGGSTADLAAFATQAESVRWLRRGADGAVDAVLVPNGASRSSALQISANGAKTIVPLPGYVTEAA